MSSSPLSSRPASSSPPSVSALTSTLERALASRDREAVWAELEPLRPQLGQDRDVASAWVTLLQASPGRRGALDDVRSVLESFADDPELVVEATIALVRMAERDPDAPHLHSAALELGDRATARALVGTADSPALLAARGNVLRLSGASRDAEAVASLERAITRESRGEWLYDLGLCHKWAGRFRAALLAFERAREKLGATRGVLFNIAICATAAGAAEAARDAWSALGHDARLEPGSLPFVEGLPPIQVRVPTRGSGHLLDASIPDHAIGFERVWAQPLGPCHGVVRSPTFRDAIADFGALILWDAAPVGWSTHEGKRVPVMPLLHVLSPGDERRFRFLALEQSAGDVDAIAVALGEGAQLLPLGTRVERVCPRCMAGEVLRDHTHEPPVDHRVVHGKLVVPASQDLATVARIIEEARARAPGVLLAVPGLYEALGDTARAGKNHKSWGAIEHGALKRLSTSS